MEKPLSGKRILITRPEEQAKEWADELAALGAETIVLPLIRVIPVTSPELTNIDKYDWIVFSSSNAVRFFGELVKELPETIKIAVVGPSTMAACEKQKWKVNFMPDEFTGKALADQLPGAGGKRILFPTTDLAGDELENILSERRATLQRLIVYRTEKALEKGEELTNIISQGIDVLTFASPSTVECFAELTDEKTKGIPAVCIGPSTEEKAKQSGFKKIIRTKENTVTGLTNAIIEHFRHEKQAEEA
jgi:uroporphyrinogen-III synthase